MVSGILIAIAVVVGVALRGRSKHSFHKRFESILKEAISANLISAEQRTELLAIAEKHRRGVHIHGATWVAIFSGLFVVAGVSLLIAHNWESIGALSRIIVFVLLFALLGEGCVRAIKRPRSIYLPLEFLWFFAPLLGIGLYGQTFQLSGDPLRPFVVWLALTAPMIWLSPYRAVGIAHLIGLATLLLVGSHAPGMLNLGSHPSGTWTGVSLQAWLAMPVIWAVLIAGCKRVLPSSYPTWLTALVIVWISSLVIGETPFETDHPGWLFIGAASFAVLWLMVPLWLNRSETIPRMQLLPIAGIVYAMTFLWHTNDTASGDASPSGIVVISLAFLGAVILTLFDPLKSLPLSKRSSLLARVIIAAFLALSLGTMAPSVIGLRILALIANLVMGGAAVFLMWQGAKLGEKRHINTGVVILLVLLVTRFIDVLGNMFRSGVGFIVAGLLLGTLGYLLERGRKHLLTFNRRSDA